MNMLHSDACLAGFLFTQRLENAMAYVPQVLIMQPCILEPMTRAWVWHTAHANTIQRAMPVTEHLCSPCNYSRCIVAHVCADACMQAGSQASSSASGSDANSHSDSDSDSSADSQPAAAEQGVQAMQNDGNEQVKGQAAASGGHCLYCMHFQTLTD